MRRVCSWVLSHCAHSLCRYVTVHVQMVSQLYWCITCAMVWEHAYYVKWSILWGGECPLLWCTFIFFFQGHQLKNTHEITVLQSSWVGGTILSPSGYQWSLKTDSFLTRMLFQRAVLQKITANFTFAVVSACVCASCAAVYIVHICVTHILRFSPLCLMPSYLCAHTCSSTMLKHTHVRVCVCAHPHIQHAYMHIYTGMDGWMCAC